MHLHTSHWLEMPLNGFQVRRMRTLDPMLPVYFAG
jgi:hypothetical protein